MVPAMFPAPPSRPTKPFDHHRHPGRPRSYTHSNASAAGIVRVLAIAFIVGSAGLVALPSPATAQSVQGNATGTVMDADGNPLEAAVVELRRDLAGDLVEYHRTTTTADGAFQVGGLDAGNWHLSARLDGYRTNESTFTLSAGGTHATDIELLSMFEAYYDATVLDGESQDPIAGAVATVTGYGDGGDGGGTATSDADGNLRLRLFANENQIRIVRSGYETYHDWVWSPRGNVERTIHLQTAPEQTVTIIGRVVDDATGAGVQTWIDLSPDWQAYQEQRGDPEPASDSQATEPAEPSPPQDGGSKAPSESTSLIAPEPYPGPRYNNHNNTITDEDGTFTMNAYPGHVLLNANRRGYLVEQTRTELSDGQTWNIEIRLVALPERTVTISGTVHDDATGNALRGASVQVQVADAGDSQWTETDDQGAYSIEVRPGYTIIEVRHWGHHDHYEVAADGGVADSRRPAYQSREYHPEIVTLETDASSSHELEHRLSARPEPTSTLVGYVINADTGEAVANAHVNIENHDTRDWGNAETDRNGSYRFELYGGHHTISVWIDGYLPARMTIQVADDGTQRQDLMVTPGTWANEGWWHPDQGQDHCCIAYAEDGEASSDAPAPRPAMAPTSGSSDDMGGSRLESASNQAAGAPSGGNLRGAGGGLPAYDPSAQDETFGDDQNESPGPGALALVAVMGVLALIGGTRRRQ